MRRLSVKRMTYYSILIALNVVLTRFGSIRIGGGGVEIVRIGFGGFPIIFAGIVLGPVAGAIVGGVGDIVGFIISPIGPYMPHFTIAAILTGVIPGLIMKLFNRPKFTFWKLVIAIGIGQVITSVLLVPIFLQRLFSTPLVVTIPTRIQSQLIQIPLYAFFVRTIEKRLSLSYENR